MEARKIWSLERGHVPVSSANAELVIIKILLLKH